jgi:hypothetical protein
MCDILPPAINDTTLSSDLSRVTASRTPKLRISPGGTPRIVIPGETAACYPCPCPTHQTVVFQTPPHSSLPDPRIAHRCTPEKHVSRPAVPLIRLLSKFFLQTQQVIGLHKQRPGSILARSTALALYPVPSETALISTTRGTPLPLRPSCPALGSGPSQRLNKAEQARLHLIRSSSPYLIV